MFISFEGTDGAGKSVQIKLFKEYLEKTFDKEVVLVRDPGSTSISEKLRDIVLDVNNQEMSYRTEALIYSASRAQMVDEIINPKLKEDAFVLTDRYIDSSLVYQGVARGLGVDEIIDINQFAVNGTYPELTFFLDIDITTSISRKHEMKNLDRIEIADNSFFETVRLGYKTIQNIYPNRIKIIDAGKSIDEVHNSIIEIFNEYVSSNGCNVSFSKNN